MQRFIEGNNIVAGFLPVDMQTAANDGDWVNLAQYRRVGILLFKAAGTAGDDPTLTIEQATDNAGAGAKALKFTDIYTKANADVLTIAQFTKVVQTLANTFVDLTHAELEAIYYVEFDDEDLDVANDFTHIRGRVADIGANAQLGCLLYLLLDATYQSDLAPTAID